MSTIRSEISIATKSKLFRGLGDLSRLAIIEVLREGALSVSGIVEATGLSQPNVSNHLACLLDCGLVQREQRGRFAIYDLSDARVDELVSVAEALLADAARGVGACSRYVEAEG